MDSDLEQRWQRAVVAKNITQDELSRLVAKMEAGVMVPSNWNQRIRDSIEKEKAEVEKRYRVKIGRTSITCSRCGSPCGFGGHACQDVRLERLREAKKTGGKMEATVSQSDSGGISRSTPCRAALQRV